MTYRDAGQRFSVGYPRLLDAGWAVTAGVKFDGGDDSMYALEFITLPQGMTVMAYAQQDVAAVERRLPRFQAGRVGLPSTEVAKAVVLGFEAQGTSTVTGKAYAARGDRYYIPLSDGRLAVLTVVGPKSHYDREGVRDIALTLQGDQMTDSSSSPAGTGPAKPFDRVSKTCTRFTATATSKRSRCAGRTSRCSRASSWRRRSQGAPGQARAPCSLS